MTMKGLEKKPSDQIHGLKRTEGWRTRQKKKNSGWKKRQREWKIIGVEVCVPPWGIRTALCVMGISIMCEQNLQIPFALLGTDSVVAVRAAHLCLGSLQTLCLGLKFKESLFGSHSFTTALCHPSIQPIESHGNKKSFTLCSFLQLFSVSSFHYSIFVFITLVLTAIGLIGTGRVRRLLNWASRWLSRSWCVCVCVFGVCVLVSTHGCFSANEVNSVERK